MQNGRQLFIEFGMKGYHTSLGSFRTEVRRAEQSHQIGEYGLLQKAVTRQLQRRKKKKRDRVADSLSHCHSLDRLQQLNAQKNEEIKRHIYQKAQYQAHNEELKQLIANPTLREHKLHLKITQLEEQNRLLKLQLQQYQSAHREELERLKNEHKTEIEKIQHQKQKNYSQIIQHRGQSPRNDTPNNSESYRMQPINYSMPTAKDNREPSTHTTYSHAQNNTLPINNVSNRIQASRSSTNNYGSPVYISAGKREEAKSTLPRTLSPDISKNTTSQTRLYRQESPLPHTAATNPPKIIQVNSPATDLPRANRPTIDPIRKTENIPQYSRQSTTIRVSPPKEGVGSWERRFGEGDLQQIYKKYCIND